MSKGEKYVNVPRDIEDDFYRYKMPVLRAKVEGRGNGIKTVVENMAEIAKALERPPDYPTKFFGFELGALTKVDNENDKYIVNGRHEAADLAKVLDQFIAKFVLCGSCRNPETEMIIKGENIGLKCRACGATTEADPTNKLSTYVLKNPPKPEQKKEAVSRRDKKAQKEKEKKKVEQEKGEEDDDNWVLDTSKEAVEARRRELLGANERLTAAGAAAGDDEDGEEKPGDGEKQVSSAGKEKKEKSKEADGDDKEEDKVVVAVGEAGTALQLKPGANPLKLLQEFFTSKPDDTEIVKQVTGLAARERWSEGQLLKTVFGSLFDGTFRTDFYTKAETLSLFVHNEKHQKVVLYCIEKLCQMDNHVITSIADVLHGFWEEDVLDEALLLKWYNHPNKRLDPKLSRKIRDGSKVFIEWLQNAEEEDSEEF